jgi:hypothetical protein
LYRYNKVMSKVGAVQVECRLTRSLKATGFRFQPLNLKCDILVSKFAFKFDLCRYAKLLYGKVGLYTLNP